MSDFKEIEIYSTLENAINKFLAKYPNKKPVISGINRSILPTFGLDLSGSRMTRHEQTLASQIASKINLNHHTKNSLLKRAEATWDKTELSSTQRKTLRSHVNNFLVYLESHKYLKLDLAEQEKTEKKYGRKRNGRSLTVDKSSYRQTKSRTNKSEIKLSFDPRSYKNTETISKDKIAIELSRIKQELDDFCCQYQKIGKGCRKITAEGHVERAKRLLGWFYKTQNVTIEDVSFKSIISVVNINVNFVNYQGNNFFEAKGRLEYEAKELAKNNKKFILKFFENYNVSDAKTKCRYLDTAIAMAKYLYRDITDEDEAENFQDIPVVRVLCALRRKLPTRKTKSVDLLMSWSEVLEVRDAWRSDCNDPYFYSQRKATKTRSARIEKIKRSKYEMSRSLQKFLILSLLTVIPTDRIRTIRELKLGKTLKIGNKTEYGFVPYDKLSSLKEAKYYIHLYPEDYKTGDSYGEFWGEIPNCQFSDYSYLYSYLNKWLFQGYRKTLLEFGGQDHEYVFMMSRTSKPHNKDSISRIVNHIFNSKTGIKVNPHKLRHIFRTYIERRDDISEQEKKSIAKWMHHSNDIANTVYTNLTAQEELQPGFDLMKKLNEVQALDTSD